MPKDAIIYEIQAYLKEKIQPIKDLEAEINTALREYDLKINIAQPVVLGSFSITGCPTEYIDRVLTELKHSIYEKLPEVTEVSLVRTV